MGREQATSGTDRPGHWLRYPPSSAPPDNLWRQAFRTRLEFLVYGGPKSDRQFEKLEEARMRTIVKKDRRSPSGAAVKRDDLTVELYKALFEEWAEQGYRAISLERVAVRAGVGKAAIYRRWTGKQEFASQAIQSVGIGLAHFSDHGSLEADLTAYLLMARRVFRHRLVRRILPDLQAERVRSGDLSDALDRLTAARRRLGRLLLERAMKRGELAKGIDVDLALDLMPAPLHLQMVAMGKMVRRDTLRKHAAMLVVALNAC